MSILASGRCLSHSLGLPSKGGHLRKGFKPVNQTLDETKETWAGGGEEIQYLALHLEIHELLESRDGIHAH